MKTDMYCYMENRTKLALPSGVPGYSDAFETGSTPPTPRSSRSTCIAGMSAKTTG